jgi:hypothetical protein
VVVINRTATIVQVALFSEMPCGGLTSCDILIGNFYQKIHQEINSKRHQKGLHPPANNTSMNPKE